MPNGKPYRIGIVGASLAGTQAAVALRRADFDGSIVMVGEEPHYPYDRPPLSKDFLAGTTEVERLRLRAVAEPDALDIEWKLGRQAIGLVQIDGGASAKPKTRVVLDDASALDLDGLLIATGARPRTLPGTADIAGIHQLRSLEDAIALKDAIEARRGPVVVIGCGFIGAEVAATARQAGADVIIIEAAEAPLERVLDRQAGLAIVELHRGHGVDVRLSTAVSGFETDNGRVSAVVLGDGTTVEAATVVVGIGVTPNTDWLLGSDLTVDNGIVADATCLAGPGIVVAGDVARWPNPRYGGALTRVEQWDNAVEMGTYAGKRLLALARDEQIAPFDPVPWFWSDQYDRKIQLAGVSSPNHELLQGSMAEQRFVQAYLDAEGALVGALCWNRPRQAIMARQIIASGGSMAEAVEKLS